MCGNNFFKVWILKIKVPVHWQNPHGWDHWASGWSEKCSEAQPELPEPGDWEMCIFSKSGQRHLQWQPMKKSIYLKTLYYQTIFCFVYFNYKIAVIIYEPSDITIHI